MSVLEREGAQGQALLLVGPTARGKSLLSNIVISELVGVLQMLPIISLDKRALIKTLGVPPRG